MPLAPRVGGVAFFCRFFGTDVLGLFPNGFCLESLILAQDERWRRA